MNKIEALNDLRAFGTRLAVAASWAATFVLAWRAAILGGPAVEAFVISALINLIPTYFALKKVADDRVGYSVALMVAAQPALFVYAMQLSPWQIDMHMYFFVGLAMLTVYCSVPPILLASVLIALHHLTLAFTASDWVFSQGGGIERVLIHALAVALQAAALSVIAQSLGGLFRNQEASHEASAELLLQAQQARTKAEEALAEADKEREARAQLLIERKNELAQLTERFEQSVSQVTSSVSEATNTLKSAAEDLDDVATATGNRASEAVAAAKQSKNSVHGVAMNISALTQSMTEIAATAAQQNQLAQIADDCSRRGNSSVSSLSERSKNIGNATDVISDIATRTSILALNATIEAAVAGEVGKGFAVVAEEVKGLASEAGNATSKINDLLSEMRHGTSEAEQSFGGISSSVEELTKAAAIIQTAVDEQQVSATSIESNAQVTSTGVDEMTRSIEDVSAGAEKTGQLSSEVRQSVGTLINQVKTLENATRDFVQVLNAA